MSVISELYLQEFTSYFVAVNLIFILYLLVSTNTYSATKIIKSDSVYKNSLISQLK